MRSRAVISGQVSEQMAPYLPGFNHNPSEARFIGKPIDFVVFSGLDGKSVEEVVFVEVKTGGSRVSPVERSLKDAIEGGRVRWEEYRFGG
jgi:predicted Holliday junction resolvase-like endonuclease